LWSTESALHQHHSLTPVPATMVQLRVKTALQEDYVQLLPFHAAQPTPSKSGGQANPPLFAVAADGNQELNIFHVAEGDQVSISKLYNIYFDGASGSWQENDTGWVPAGIPSPAPGILKAGCDPSDGSLHVAFAHILTNTDSVGNVSYIIQLYYLNVQGRYPIWRTTNLQWPWPLQTVPSLSMDLAFREGTVPFLTVCVSVVTATQIGNEGHSRLWTWAPSEGAPQMSTDGLVNVEPNPPIVPEGNVPQALTIRDPVYAQFPVLTPGREHSLQWGWHLTQYFGDGSGVSDPIYGGGDFVLRSVQGNTTWGVGYFSNDTTTSTGAPGLLPLPYRSIYRYAFAASDASSPLLFALRSRSIFQSLDTGMAYQPNQIYFVPNTVYNGYAQFGTLNVNSMNPDAYQMFTDVAGTPIAFEVGTRVLDVATENDIDWGLNVFALFEVSDSSGLKSVELWHTETLDGAVTRLQDGVYTYVLITLQSHGILIHGQS
jgi:hypothetical protein